MPINRACKKVSNYVKKFLMRPCKKVETSNEYLASEKFSTARIHFSITKTDDFYLTEGWATLHYTEKSFVSTSVNVNNVSTDLRSLRDYCPPHTSELTLKTDLRPSCSFAAQLKWQSSRVWDWKQIHIWAKKTRLKKS